MTTVTIKGLNYKVSARIGECGVKNEKLYFPMFLMGACGDDQAVISWNGEREILVPPKEMNYNWFKLLSLKLKKYPMFDWDWCSFRKNILEPNKEHLKKSLNIDDEKVDVFLNDGYVFINNFDEGLDESEEYIYPNFKNFLEKNLKELDY